MNHRSPAMSQIHLNNALLATSLRDAATPLKAALVVSAAAILSQAKPDLDANAAAARQHLDVFCHQLHAMRDGILLNRDNAAALAVVSRASTVQLDTDVLDQAIALVELE